MRYWNFKWRDQVEGTFLASKPGTGYSGGPQAGPDPDQVQSPAVIAPCRWMNLSLNGVAPAGFTALAKLAIAGQQ
jgi:hypothetical protein